MHNTDEINNKQKEKRIRNCIINIKQWKFERCSLFRNPTTTNLLYYLLPIKLCLKDKLFCTIKIKYNFTNIKNCKRLQHTALCLVQNSTLNLWYTATQVYYAIFNQGQHMQCYWNCNMKYMMKFFDTHNLLFI